MSTLAVAYLPSFLVVLILGILIGWLVSRYKNQHIQEDLLQQNNQLKLRIASQNKALIAQQSDLNIALKDNRSILNEFDDTQTEIKRLRGQLALAHGQAQLNSSRWQNCLKQARQLPALKIWITSLQRQLAQQRQYYQENRLYCKRLSDRLDYTNAHVKRIHTSLTKLHMRYRRLRKYADALQIRKASYQADAVRAHTRLTEIEGKLQPLRIWISVLQKKLNKTKTDKAQLRSYTNHIKLRLTTYKQSLDACQIRLTAVSKQINTLQQQPLNTTVVDVNDSIGLRLLDRIRLLGTSKSSFLGRVYNQIVEAKSETVETQHRLNDMRVSKDIRIKQLQEKITHLDTQLEQLPSLKAEYHTRVTELERTLDKIHTESIQPLQDVLREHQYTISAYRYKLAHFQLS